MSAMNALVVRLRIETKPAILHLRFVPLPSLPENSEGTAPMVAVPSLITRPIFGGSYSAGLSTRGETYSFRPPPRPSYFRREPVFLRPAVRRPFLGFAVDARVRP